MPEIQPERALSYREEASDRFHRGNDLTLKQYLFPKIEFLQDARMYSNGNYDGFTAAMTTSSTATFFGSRAGQKAERVCCPFSPRTRKNRSEAPSRTFGASCQSGALAT